jgi:hypothetical protein
MDKVNIIIIPKGDRTVIAIRYEDEDPRLEVRQEVSRIVEEFCNNEDTQLTCVTEYRGISEIDFTNRCQEIANPRHGS